MADNKDNLCNKALMSTCAPKPEWLRVKAPTGDKVAQLKHLINQQRLNTVCSSAACPNMGECWDLGTATFMILGNQCTRACRFCNVQSKMRPFPVDLDEPQRLVESALAMNLKHVVITSVARDDLPDGGAQQFARCLLALKNQAPHMSSEVLVPDFLGSEENLALVTNMAPTIFNHNLETIRRLTPKIRSGARYDRSLALLATAKKQRPEILSKSGIMLGLGEEDHEIEEVLYDLRAHNVDQLTIGQYLRPSAWHHPVHRYAHPDIFASLKIFAQNLGFSHVESGPLVRSSYHAERGVARA